MRTKAEVRDDDKKRFESVMFMALCGTDYSIALHGLGIKRLLSGVVSDHAFFFCLVSARQRTDLGRGSGIG